MPGYDEHRRVAELVAVVTSLATGVLIWQFTNDGRLALTAGSIAFVSVNLGAPLPDLDSPSSIPRRRLRRALQLSAGLSILSIAVWLWDPLVGALRQALGPQWNGLLARSLLAISVVVFAVAASLILPPILENRLPHHRGVLHDIRFWVAVIGGVVALIYFFDVPVFGSYSIYRDTVVMTAAGGILVGVIVHIAVDSFST